MAYCCISSLMQTLKQLLQAKSPLICESFIQQHVESSYQSLCTLQVFLEDTTNEANDIENLKILENKIKDVVYKAEDRVDSCLTNIILAQNEDDREKACKFFNEELQQIWLLFFSNMAHNEVLLTNMMKETECHSSLKGGRINSSYTHGFSSSQIQTISSFCETLVPPCNNSDNSFFASSFVTIF